LIATGNQGDAARVQANRAPIRFKVAGVRGQARVKPASLEAGLSLCWLVFSQCLPAWLWAAEWQ